MLFRIFMLLMIAMIFFAVVYGQKTQNNTIYVEVISEDYNSGKLNIKTNASTMMDFLKEENELNTILKYDNNYRIFVIQEIYGKASGNDKTWKIEKKIKDNTEIVESYSLENIQIKNKEHYVFTLVDKN